MIAAILILCVVAGIAYPYVHQVIRARRPDVNAESAPPDDYALLHPGAVSTERDELCPQCSRVNPAHQRICLECGCHMPVSGIANLLESVEQEDLVREGIQAGSLLVVMLIAMTLANFLPMPGKIFILLLTVIALGYRFMRVLSN